jgi:hypothetical protein
MATTACGRATVSPWSVPPESTAHIQLQNVALFERLGWHKHGEVEVYVGVHHQPMAIDLQAARR